ncbi:hypothetical protein Tco_0653344 [Tanacetum coccineum]|uniref:Retrovirus-related Pol polyprotein from transposon TNT 1-94 n=1 Tax=Tanacetum coccineum TaxID=301880 RepID=A0ABQ4X0B8_9ASTR
MALAISTTKAEYVSVGKACQQALWMKQALIDYDIRLDDVSIIMLTPEELNLPKHLIKAIRKSHLEILLLQAHIAAFKSSLSKLIMTRIKVAEESSYFPLPFYSIHLVNFQRFGGSKLSLVVRIERLPFNNGNIEDQVSQHLPLYLHISELIIKATSLSHSSILVSLEYTFFFLPLASFLVPNFLFLLLLSSLTSPNKHIPLWTKSS